MRIWEIEGQTIQCSGDTRMTGELLTAVRCDRTTKLWRKCNQKGEALFKKFCKRDFCDEVRDFKIPEPEAVAS